MLEQRAYLVRGCDLPEIGPGPPPAPPPRYPPSPACRPTWCGHGLCCGEAAPGKRWREWRIEDERGNWRCGRRHAWPAGSVAVAGAARRVRDPLYGQQRSCGLCGLACRAAVCGARLPDADRPADLQPLAGPRVRPDGQRPRVGGPVGPGPADLLLSLLRADAARRRDRPPGRSRLLPGRQRLHRGVLGAGPGRDRPGPDRAAGVPAGSGPDADRRLRAGPDLRRGGHRVRGVRRRADQSCLAGHIRAGSAARREERRSARRGRRLDGAARR